MTFIKSLNEIDHLLEMVIGQGTRLVGAQTLVRLPRITA